MAIMRYAPRRVLSPWPEFAGLANRLPRLFNEPWETSEQTASWFPAVNVEEGVDELILTAELPGISEDDVHLDIENNILTVRGEKREVREEGDDKGNVHVRERRYGSFQRAFTLPKSVTTDKIEAEFDNGILTVRMPKTEQAKSRTIEIKNSN